MRVKKLTVSLRVELISIELKISLRRVRKRSKVPNQDYSSPACRERSEGRKNLNFLVSAPNPILSNPPISIRPSLACMYVWPDPALWEIVPFQLCACLPACLPYTNNEAQRAHDENEKLRNESSAPNNLQQKIDPPTPIPSSKLQYGKVDTNSHVTGQIDKVSE